MVLFALMYVRLLSGVCNWLSARLLKAMAMLEMLPNPPGLGGDGPPGDGPPGGGPPGGGPPEELDPPEEEESWRKYRWLSRCSASMVTCTQ